MKWFSMVDELMVLGYQFHPETVIIDITDLKPYSAEDDVFTQIETHCVKPPFRHVFIQMDARKVLDNPASPLKRVGHYIQSVTEDGITQSYMIGYVTLNPPFEPVKTQGSMFRFKFDEEGHHCADGSWVWLGPDEITNKGIPESERFGFQWSLPGLDCFLHTPGGTETPFNTDVLLAFYYMHQKAPIDLVEPSTKHIKWAKQKKGKEPSPYFVLVGGKPVKSTDQATHGGGYSGKRAVHIVRGHFLTHPPDHPIPHFAGRTFWINDHLRGSPNEGEVKKGYCIRPMPKE